MSTPDFLDEQPEREEQAPPPARQEARPAARAQPRARRGEGIWAAGDRVIWVSGLVLTLSSFMGWYAGGGEGPAVSVIGWHTGVLGKLVFFVGLAVLALAILRELGVELPPAVPESLAIVALGALATIFVLIRVISIPDTFAGTSGRGIGLWISLLAGVGVIVGGLLRAGEEL